MKRIIIILVSMLLLCGCGEYKNFEVKYIDTKYPNDTITSFCRCFTSELEWPSAYARKRIRSVSSHINKTYNEWTLVVNSSNDIHVSDTTIILLDFKMVE